MKHGHVWSVAAAKARFSEVIATARDTGQPQRIENRGHAVAVVVATEQFEALRSAGAYRAFLDASAALRAESPVKLRVPTRRSRRVPSLGE